MTNTVNSNFMEDYVAKLKEDICSVCAAAFSPTASCDTRDSGHCALDAYLPFVIGTIEAFFSEKGKPLHT